MMIVRVLTWVEQWFASDLFGVLLFYFDCKLLSRGDLLIEHVVCL